MAAAALTISGAAPSAASRPDADAEAISQARLLQAALDGVRGLVGPFTQTVESPGLPRPRVERGTMYVQRPGRMRWAYDDPEGKLAVADGVRTWVYLPEERQVLVAPLEARRPEPGVGLLLRARVDILSEFAVTREPSPRHAAPRLRLTPRDRDAAYAWLVVEIGPDHLPRALSAVDALGGMVTYRFGRLEKHAALDEALFRFTPPPGVEVQEVVP